MPEAIIDRTWLSRRLTFALLVPIVLLVVMGGVLGRQLLLMAEDAKWVDHSLEVLMLENQTSKQIVDQETGIRGYLITNKRSFLEPYERANPLPGFDRLVELTADNPAQRQRFVTARDRYQKWVAEVIDAASGRDLDGARSESTMEERKRLVDLTRESLTEGRDVEERLLHERTAASDRSQSITGFMFVSLLLISALVIGFGTRRQLGSIAAIFTAALDRESEARKQIEREAWIRALVARVADALQGDYSVAQLGEKILGVLVDGTGAQVGAVFTRNGSRWTRRAGHALDASAVAELADGEGLIGEVARTGTTRDLRELPADYLKLRGGTGDTAPVRVIAFPARAGGITYAVVELGFLRDPDERAVEAIERVRENIALAIRSAEHRQRVQELLEETQRQAEELQTQQEELRVQNEELEQTTRVVQDSRTTLAKQHADLAETNAQLEEQTAELEAQRDDLSRAQLEAQRANSYKSEFLANMSHELRTPLNSTLILAKLLADNRHGNLDDEQVKHANTIYSAGNDLLALINDILDLSKIEAGKLDVRPESIPLARLADDLSSMFQPLARDRQLELAIAVDPKTPAAIETDPTRIHQILKNLLANAIKFTERGGVTLTIRPAGNRVEFAVRDTGIGIARDQHQVIFEAFRQADGTTNRKYGGTGLGLSISRDLAHLLGGDLAVDSEPGRGSTFTLTLPIRYAGTAAVAAPPPRQPNGSPKRAAVRGPASGRSLLIIEDDREFAGILSALAKEVEFQPLVAHTAEDGLVMAIRDRPSAVILDIGLPDRSGLTVLDALKHDPATRHIPVHIMSVEDYSHLALEMGATGYEIKPVKREQLVAALQRLESKVEQKIHRVLVVEDDERQRDATCKLLEADGVELVAVGTAAAALVQLGGTTFDCMVLDLSLPDRSGFELLEEMSRGQQYSFPPVIVYTGKSLSHTEEQQLRRLSSSIIVKGARSPERLLDEVSLFLHQVEESLPPDRQRMLRDARHREAVFEGRRVLVVEDDIRNIYALSAVLEPKGAKIEIARNGKEALAHLEANPGVDLVLMDIMMPEMDGITAMREIRKHAGWAKLPIIALTAKAMPDDRESCLAAGANDYIAKPLDVDKLLSLARVWMPK